MIHGAMTRVARRRTANCQAMACNMASVICTSNSGVATSSPHQVSAITHSLVQFLVSQCTRLLSIRVLDDSGNSFNEYLSSIYRNDDNEVAQAETKKYGFTLGFFRFAGPSFFEARSKAGERKSGTSMTPTGRAAAASAGTASITTTRFAPGSPYQCRHPPQWLYIEKL